MKIGSLFDGSGGFPLAAAMCGGIPVWASEVEPYPIAVTRSRFPNMKHLGSVTDVKGNEVEPVDVITFGSPCQDLSVAGKRAGLKHTENGDDETTRSGLFMEAVRIIKEMREATNGLYPRFAVWENVPGAFSSNKGEDFRIVLEEFVKVVEPTAVMPDVPKNGWPYADVYCGDGWSLAYRVLDAQYWGVPQRRRRIYLVADFRGQCAGKVSFEREGLRGYFTQSGSPREAAPGDAESGIGTADCAGGGVIGFDGYNSADTGDKAATLGVNCGMSTGRNGVCVPYTLKIRSGCEGGGKGALVQEDRSATLATNNDQYLFQPVAISSKQQSLVTSENIANTLGANDYKEPQAVFQPVCSSGEVAGTLDASYYKGCGMRQGVEREYVVEQHLFENHSQDSRYRGPLDVCPMLPAQLGTGGNNQPFVVEGSPVYCLQGNGIDRADTAGCNGKGWNDETCYTLNTIDRLAVAYAMQGFGDYKDCGVASGLKARDFKDATDLVTEAQPIALDRAFFNQGANALYDPQFYTDGTVPTLVARGPSAVAVRYIVRRLTPTECARLQGFPDAWGHPNIKEFLSDEEYRFWLETRNLHASINGKATKEYTKEQMLKWYNGLHTDSSEYKMWGNGIALPCALYVMQGIAEALNEN